jgi:hypothetical protein
MPKLKDYRAAHYTNTSKVSDNVRSLALSAIGIVWIFKKQIGDGFQIPSSLYLPLLLVFSAMALDFLQYLYSSTAWYIFFRCKEKQNIDEEKDFDAPPIINLPSYILFYGKVVTIGIAYLYLIIFLINQVRWYR